MSGGAPPRGPRDDAGQLLPPVEVVLPAETLPRFGATPFDLAGVAQMDPDGVDVIAFVVPEFLDGVITSLFFSCLRTANNYAFAAELYVDGRPLLGELSHNQAASNILVAGLAMLPSSMSVPQPVLFPVTAGNTVRLRATVTAGTEYLQFVGFSSVIARLTGRYWSHVYQPNT